MKGIYEAYIWHQECTTIHGMIVKEDGTVFGYDLNVEGKRNFFDEKIGMLVKADNDEFHLVCENDSWSDEGSTMAFVFNDDADLHGHSEKQMVGLTMWGKEEPRDENNFKHPICFIKVDSIGEVFLDAAECAGELEDEVVGKNEFRKLNAEWVKKSNK